PTNHLGVHPQKQNGLLSIGVPVHLGLISGDQMIAVSDLAERLGGDVRVTRQQNFVLAGVPEPELEETLLELERIGFTDEEKSLRGNAIACTGEPHCNFSVAAAKTRLGAAIEVLEQRFGPTVAELRRQL